MEIIKTLLISTEEFARIAHIPDVVFTMWFELPATLLFVLLGWIKAERDKITQGKGRGTTD